MFENHPITEKPDTESIEVSLHFRDTNEGGRNSSVKSGYRTQFHFVSDEGLDSNDWTIALQFEGTDWVHPGGSVQANGIFLCAEPFQRVRAHMRFQLREGQKIVADGEVLSKYL